MKKLLYVFLLFVSINSLALTGKQEFTVNYDDVKLKFINDGKRMVVLEFTSGGPLTKDSNIKCGVAPIKENVANFGDNIITFYSEYATLNTKKKYYDEKKTELFFYNDICPKLK